MRIPRTNFPPASFHDDQEDGTPDERQMPDGAALRRMRVIAEAAAAEQPNWERHFFLAPNVRFTRTPDRDLYPELQSQSGGEAQTGEPKAADTSPSVAELREMLSTMMILSGGGTAPVSAVPMAADTPVNDNAAVAEVAQAVIPAEPEIVLAPVVEEKPVPMMPVLSHLSDFAFWEALDFAPEATTPVESVQPAQTVEPVVTVSSPMPVSIPVIQPVPVAQPVLQAVPVPQAAALVSIELSNLYRSIPIQKKIAPATQPTPAPTAQAVITPTEVVAPAAVAVVPAVQTVHIAPAATVAATAPAQPVVWQAPSLAPSPSEPAPAPAGNWPWNKREKTVGKVEAVVQPAKPAAATVVVAPAPAVAVAAPVKPVLQRIPVPVTDPAPRASVPVSMPFNIERVTAPRIADGGYEFPPRELLQDPPEVVGEVMTQEQLERNAGLLESVLEDFGIRGEIIHVRPGPVVTLYEFEPAPGVKSSRVIGLADDIARSMSALSARVAVVPGRNVIGIELPNATRETVYFGELIDTQDFSKTGFKLPLCLGKTIGGEPVIAELAKMPHLLVAGTTGSGKSVAINTMILSLLYRLTPQECRLIMVDPKMLELSVYDGIPHLLTPVVTDPKKAVLALKWAVREMEDRYRKMSRLGVRNIDGYNARVAEARDRGETINHVVQTGFEKGTGEPIHENLPLDLAPMPYIVVIVDEMADLMMVAGKEIEGAIQRLAQMARAAGIHLIMATQRPSVDVITGTIKANFPTRISFQVTSKIDSRTILGEQGAEQLLGQGDMLHMAGGGRIMRVHGPFVSDHEVEKVVAHLKTQGRPEYLDTVTVDEDAAEEEAEDTAVFDKSDMAAEDGNDLYDKAVKVILRDKKCSTSYIQRRLGIGYNKAASLVERMEKDGLVGPANHVGKREILHGNSADADRPFSSDT
jgi:S-DNA-T family DNA segregation ATPase FtsK/SpoIIIE